MARITQGYVSKSIMDFPFHETYKLADYYSYLLPSVFFGMYRYEDLQLLANHKNDKHILWTGQDALKFEKWDNLNGSKSFTAHPKVKALIESKGHECKLVQPGVFLNEVKSQKLGPYIYAYCPSSAPEYHGRPIINELCQENYDIQIGFGGYTQKQWREKEANEFYKDTFIGLCLSEFAGGGGSIIEMGLRGIKVVTNVFNLPNCIPWNSVQDIRDAIEIESKNIGTRNERLANKVWSSLDHRQKWIEI